MTKNLKKRNLINKTAQTVAVTERIANNTYQNLHRLDSLVSVVLSALMRKGVVSQEELDAEFRLLTQPAEAKNPEVANG
jgi:ribosomal protein L5